MTPCVEWTGARDRAGYGRESRRTNGYQRFAHRAAWEDARGPIPDGMHVLHKCDNPGCVNLDHLWLGTHGELNGTAKLTSEQVAAIRYLRHSGALLRDLSAEFGVHVATISRIARNERWAPDDDR